VIINPLLVRLASVTLFDAVKHNHPIDFAPPSRPSVFLQTRSYRPTFERHHLHGWSREGATVQQGQQWYEDAHLFFVLASL
jgi:hypothetical protein